MQKNLIPVRLFYLAIPISCPAVCKFHEVRKPVLSCHLFDKLLGFFIVHSFAGHIQRLLSFFATMPATCPVRVSSLYFCVAVCAFHSFGWYSDIPVKTFPYFVPLFHRSIELDGRKSRTILKCARAYFRYVLRNPYGFERYAVLNRMHSDFRHTFGDFHRLKGIAVEERPRIDLVNGVGNVNVFQGLATREHSVDFRQFFRNQHGTQRLAMLENIISDFSHAVRNRSGNEVL